MDEVTPPLVEDMSVPDTKLSLNRKSIWNWDQSCCLGCLGSVVILTMALITFLFIPFLYNEVDSDSRGNQKVSLFSSNAGGYYVRIETNGAILDERDLGYTHFNHHPEWFPNHIVWFTEDAVCVINSTGPDSMNVLPIDNGKLGEPRHATKEEIGVIGKSEKTPSLEAAGGFEPAESEDKSEAVSTP